MNTDKIVRALRDAEGNNELDCEISELRPLLLKAADLIESLQAQFSESFNAHLILTIDRLESENRRLTEGKR